MEFKMNINSDVNKNIDLLSGLKSEEQNTSILNTLFSINFENDAPSELINEEEFVFKEDEVAIINYLSNLIPNFQNENKNLLDLKKIKKQIQIDVNISPKLKENILNFLSEEKFGLKDFNVNILNKNNVNNKKSFDYMDSLKPNINQKHQSNNFVKNESKSTNVGKDESKSTNFVKNESKINIRGNNPLNKDNINISKTFENIYSENKNINKVENDKKEITNFVKKIKKNNHPNKIYQLPQSNSLKYKQLNEITSHIDQKTVDNKNLPLINNQISEASNNNKFNGNKLNNNQILNVQHSIQANNTGSNFSQQNDSSFSNSSYNSVLENFIDNLDLTQKGWTSKLTSRIEKAIQNGGEEIEFNLKPKNLGLLKVSVKFKNGVGNVKIVTENSFVTSALNQNENYLQKLFNEQGINLDFSAQNEGKKFDSRNNSNQNSQNNDKKNSTQSDINIKNSEDESDIIAKNNSSRHMINVIA
tara:strand:- start:72 stop:1496 length:1425 start_codon:yes stop_codon:yes gene_type:complete